MKISGYRPIPPKYWGSRLTSQRDPFRGKMPVIDTNKDLVALFRDQVRATPNAVALEDETGTWTYAELDQVTAALADRLRRHGVGRDNLVGVLLGRSADYVIACIAALRAGGAFLVLELAYPPGLLADVIDDAKPTVIVTHSAHVERIKANVPLIVLDKPETASKGSINGPPMDPDHIYILDEDGKKLDVGVSGELLVGGDLLARGYLNLPETTAKAFLPDPFNKKPGSRMYKTGDLARLLPSGLLEITGRVGVSGKVDLKSLPPPVTDRPRKSVVVNGAKTESNVEVKIEVIAKMWAASLKLSPDAVTQEHDFFDLGGHSLALADLARRLSTAFGFPIPLGSLAVNPTLQGHLEAVRSARDGHTAAVQADLPAILRADAVLPDDIQASGAVMRPLSEAGTVLLTGVTGFLGAFLLNSILESTAARVVCLGSGTIRFLIELNYFLEI
ncbi:putative nonribosomal peptide synthetase 10 protein [Phaeoacremonium minimum UCRPA7]|uniref:Putative nonribosomal peptide synthetase 10 protein n=1 Tax=Phaeoacremonium minimum (strain UCR-PA7) TaxID=1286976 RepID=R8BDH7_PHAM7|nr:putative nonribosomal peptide synthetase 10 protein [Phaeoacremonium minimum UCRPA7]EON97347.1 putative nonribosomal peptide synthetase 10 protein [Phaeoacremonium minimum UCRPA7]